MARHCNVCRHEKVSEINERLENGQFISLSHLAREFKAPHWSMRYHYQHDHMVLEKDWQNEYMDLYQRYADLLSSLGKKQDGKSSVWWALGVMHFSSLPSINQLTTTRRKMAKFFHSDTGGDDQYMSDVNKAHSILLQEIRTQQQLGQCGVGDDDISNLYLVSV